MRPSTDEKKKRTKRCVFKKETKPTGTTPVSNPSYSWSQPLAPAKLLDNHEKDKTKYTTFDLEYRAGADENAPSYKMKMRRFDDGTPQEWMDVLARLRVIWKQNVVNASMVRVGLLLLS